MHIPPSSIYMLIWVTRWLIKNNFLEIISIHFYIRYKDIIAIQLQSIIGSTKRMNKCWLSKMHLPSLSIHTFIRVTLWPIKIDFIELISIPYYFSYRGITIKELQGKPNVWSSSTPYTQRSPSSGSLTPPETPRSPSFAPSAPLYTQRSPSSGPPVNFDSAQPFVCTTTTTTMYNVPLLPVHCTLCV